MSAAPDKPDRLKAAATCPRLFALLLAILAATAMFEIRHAVIQNNVTPGAPKEPDWPTGPDGRRRGYPPNELHAYFKRIGPNGRELYAATQKSLDTFFPLVYGPFMIGFLARLIPGARSRWPWWAWAPVVMVIADLSENHLLSGLATDFPENATPEWEGTARCANRFTVVKWVLYYFVLCFFGSIAVLWRATVCVCRFIAWCK